MKKKSIIVVFVLGVLLIVVACKRTNLKEWPTSESYGQPTIVPSRSDENTKQYQKSADSIASNDTIKLEIFVLDTTSELESMTLFLNTTEFALLKAQIRESRLLGSEIDAIKEQINAKPSFFELKINIWRTLLLIATIGLVWLYFDFFKKRRKLIINIVESDCKNWVKGIVIKQMAELDPEMNRFTPASNKREIDQLAERISVLEEKINRQPTSQNYPNDKRPLVNKQLLQPESNPIKKLYAQSIYDGILARVKEKPNGESIFELTVKGNEATFSIYPDAKRRVLANPTACLACCDKQMIGNSEIEVINEGIARQTDAGWKVDKPLKVKII